MSQLGNVLKMLFLLKDNSFIKKKELALELGVSEKQVGRYKDILEETFNIESITGPNGGYRLIDRYFPFKEIFTKEELLVLKHSIYGMDSYLDEKENLEKIIEKINKAILNIDNKGFGEIVRHSRVNKKLRENVRGIKEKIYIGIEESKELIIEYISANEEKTERRVQPYSYFIYEGEQYLVAWCMEKKAIRFFKFVRILRCILTGKEFEKNRKVEEDIKGKKEKRIGIFVEEEYEVEIIIKPPMAMNIKERVWVENQEIIDLDNGKILFKGTMIGKISIINWLMKMKDDVEIIKPLELKEEIKKILKNMIEVYN